MQPRGREQVTKMRGQVVPLMRKGPAAESALVDKDGAPLPASNVVEDPSKLIDQQFMLAGALAPPYDLNLLAELYEASSNLRPCVDAYATNIDGFGHRFEPAIDFKAGDADEKVADVVRAGKLKAALDAKLAGMPIPSIEVTEAEVKAKRAEIERDMAIEKLELDAFFEGLNPDRSFVALRKLAREEREVLGNGYLEVVRGANGKPQQVNYLPSFTVRLTPVDEQPTMRTFKVRGPDLEYTEHQQEKRFRRFVQVFTFLQTGLGGPQSSVTSGAGLMLVYFKEYGDRRLMSARTGTYYKDAAEMKAKEKDAPAATEVLHFKIHNARYPYGVPRWIGALLAVMGTRGVEEINYQFIDGNGIPAGILAVQGGKFTEESKQRWEEFWSNKIKGRENIHKLLMVEAEADPGAVGASARPSVDLKTFTKERQQDQMFGQYMERNTDVVGQQFRLSRPMRGDIRDVNRAAFEAAIDAAELQVFGPERDDTDFQIDRTLIADLDIKYWRFASRGPAMRNPDRLQNAATGGIREGVLTVNEGRTLMGEAVGVEYPRIDEDWADRPKGAPAAPEPEEVAPGGDVFPAERAQVGGPNGWAGAPAPSAASVDAATADPVVPSATAA